MPITNLPTRSGSSHRPPSPSAARAFTAPRWWVFGGATVVAAVGLLVWSKERQHVSHANDALTAGVQLAVPAGGRAVTYPLPDGSRVTLAPGSSLTSRGAFGDSARSLDLAGEALFNVAAASVPLIVYAAGVRVRDVSTAFVVRSMPASLRRAPQVLVAVTQGEVQVTAGAWTGAVHEGQAIVADSMGQYEARGAEAVSGSVAWTSGALLFADEPVASVVERLQRWTGVPIEVDAALRDRRLTVAFEGDAPEQAVERMAAAIGARMVKRGEGWRLSAR